MNYSNLTLLIPAKEDTDCLFHVLEELKDFDVEIPTELEGMLKLTNNFDFVFGSRYLKNAKTDDDTVITSLGNYIFSKIGRIFFNIKLSDILYTFVLCNTEKTRSLNLLSEDFGFCVELPIKIERKKYTYTDLASHERKRISGKKNVNEFLDGFKILIKMIKFFFYKKI